MENKLDFERRSKLKSKMSEVFQGDIAMLSTELQEILVDDLVTAFQNRVNVLIRAQKRETW